MSGQQFRSELARQYLQYFGEKGADTPALAREIIPVVIMDDGSEGPYAPSIRWHAAAELTSSAGNFAYVGIVNNDPINAAPSVVVVDRIFAQNLTAALEFVVGIAPKTGGPVNLALGAVRDTDSGKDPASQTDPLLSNVQIGVGQAAPAGVIATQFPKTAVGVTAEIPGTFIIRPQGALLLTVNAVASGLRVYFRGRYYPAP